MRAFLDFRQNRRRFIAMLGATTVLGFIVPPFASAYAAGTVVNETQGKGYAALAAALAEARDGDAIRVTGGVHRGNFIIARSISLAGEAGATLDAGGKGTALTIRAADVAVEGFAIRGSGKTDSPFALWGDAGVAVYGDRASLARLAVLGNDWGVIFFGGEGSALRNSDVSDNAHDGVLLLGGKRHLVESNVVNRNLEGVSMTEWYPDRESPLMQSKDPVVLQDYIQKKANAPRAIEHLVRDNEVRGNAFYGVIVTNEAHNNTVAENRVFNTGKERPVDFTDVDAVEASLAAISGMDVKFSHDVYGSGILLSCLAHDNVVLRNAVHDNFAHGVVVDLSDRTRAEANAVERNRTGILVVSTVGGEFLANAVADNSEFGIRLGSEELERTACDGNLVVRNDLARNPVNAYDSSGRILTEADIKGALDELPLPKAVKEQLLKNPAALKQWIAGWLKVHKPGSNRWDDGTLGNHHDDFDEIAEGFVDADRDGVSEAGKPIPGGNAIDRHPLDVAKIAAFVPSQ